MNSFEMAGFIVFVIVMVAVIVWVGWVSIFRDCITERKMKRLGYELYGDPGFSPTHWAHRSSGHEIPGNYEAAREFLATESEGRMMVQGRRSQGWHL